MEHLAKRIQVVDDIIPAAHQRALTTLVQGPIWRYGWRSNTRRDRFAYWNASFAGGDGENRLNCERELASKPELASVFALWKALEASVLAGHEPLRVYANSHTYGVEGYVHVDNEDDENYFSTIYYAHPVWHKNWSGETVFFTPDGQNIIASVYPKPARVVSFPGHIPHRAHAPSRECAELRISIVIKTQLRATTDE